MVITLKKPNSVFILAHCRFAYSVELLRKLDVFLDGKPVETSCDEKSGAIILESMDVIALERASTLIKNRLRSSFAFFLFFFR